MICCVENSALCYMVHQIDSHSLSLKTNKLCVDVTRHPWGPGAMASLSEISLPNRLYTTGWRSGSQNRQFHFLGRAGQGSFAQKLKPTTPSLFSLWLGDTKYFGIIYISVRTLRDKHSHAHKQKLTVYINKD